MPRQSGVPTGYFRGRSHHERARCRRGAELGFGHHRVLSGVGLFSVLIFLVTFLCQYVPA